MAPLTKLQQSKIGRKSRRKGKSFEREVAKLFRDWFPGNWQTTRNSGRTDISGDIFCMDAGTILFIECKHRKDWTTASLIKGARTYRNELSKIRNDWDVSKKDVYVFVRKDVFGVWLAVGGNYTAEEIFEGWDASLCCAAGETWVLVGKSFSVRKDAPDVVF